MLVLGASGAVVSLVCMAIMVFDAYRDEAWKGVVGFLCPPYLAYYAIFEFDHERKWLILFAWILGAALGGASAGELNL